MKSATSKVLHPLAGCAVVQYVIETAATLSPAKLVSVIAPGMNPAVFSPSETCEQRTGKGTGAAVLAAREALEDFDGTVLVLLGDEPLISPDRLQSLVIAHQTPLENGLPPDMVVFGIRHTDPKRNGRLVMGANGLLDRIVEFADATEEEKQITLCNTGLMAFSGRHLFRWLDQVGENNAAGERYLTDVVAIVRQDGGTCAVVEGEPAEMVGINTRADLAAVERRMQDRLRTRIMAGGVTLQDPATTWLSWDTRIGQDTVVGPSVFFGPGVTVGKNVTVRPFCHLEGVAIADGAVVGPYARLRPGTAVGENAHIGNFVELKKTTLGAGSKANHLSYIGDATVGEGVNIGAGTITCNYDGYDKYPTTLGDRVFVGSNSTLVAPVTVQDDAYIGAGSTITSDIPAGTLGLGRAVQVIKDGWVRRFRQKKKK